MNRNAISISQLTANPHPNADTKYRTASATSTGFRPYRSAGRPTISEPMIVPINALETVNPHWPPLSPNTALSAFSVPEITAVSKPNRKPPSAATSVLPSK
jgi:hypothetical protein